MNAHVQPRGQTQPLALDTLPARCRSLIDGSCRDPSAAGKTLQSRLQELTTGFGLWGGVYVHLGHAFHADGSDRALTPTRFVAASNLDWSLYIVDGGLNFDPIARQAGAAHTPFAWTMAAYDGLSEDRRWLASRLKRRGVHGGVAIPIQDYAAGPAYVTMYSAFNDEPKTVASTRGAELAYAFTAFHQETKSILQPFRQPNTLNTLTVREINCLRLAAIGMTATGTAKSLDITARTVEFHLNNAVKKLGAVNKLQAVALSVSMGIISI